MTGSSGDDSQLNGELEDHSCPNPSNLNPSLSLGKTTSNVDYVLIAEEASADLLKRSDLIQLVDGTDAPSQQNYLALNASINLYRSDGTIPLENDKLAVQEYLRDEVEVKLIKFDSHLARFDYLVENDYYEPQVLEQYTRLQLELLANFAYRIQHEFSSFAGCYKFYTSYALRTRDGLRLLETFTDRALMVALFLARGDLKLAYALVDEILSGRFQPATPTFLNAGKRARGELVSCFLLRIEDNMESIGRAINSSLQLSKRGGGVALCLTNLRERGAPIKGIMNQSSGVVPVMKILEDSFSYANQLGARQGAGAVYLHAHHPDILDFLDTKRENADEKVRIKSLSLGVVVPDVTFELARRNEPMLLFSPYDIERELGLPMTEISITERYEELKKNPRIRKREISARRLFQTIAEIQFESGYPYLLFEDQANRSNPIKGRISMSNLCSEILQVSEESRYNPDLTYQHIGRDISCNLGSLNIAAVMEKKNLSFSVEAAIRALTAVSDLSHLDSVPSIVRANSEGHSIGLGQMNLHGYLAKEHIHYGSEEALEFVGVYFAAVAYHCYRTSMMISRETGIRFEGFEDSRYANGSYFNKYMLREWLPESPKVAKLFSGISLPGISDWSKLAKDVMKYGLYHQYLQAVPPTGSISYLNHSTSSIHPIVAKVEVRKEGKLGRIYYPAPFMSNDNLEFYQDAYDIGVEAIIDTYAVAAKHVDQGLSCTLFYPDTVTTRDLNRSYIYAWKKGLKTLYYARLRQQALSGTEVEGCVSCTL